MRRIRRQAGDATAVLKAIKLTTKASAIVAFDKSVALALAPTFWGWLMSLQVEPASRRHRRRADQQLTGRSAANFCSTEGRDAFVSAVFVEIGLPLLRTKAQRAIRSPNCEPFVYAGLIVLPKSDGASSRGFSSS